MRLSHFRSVFAKLFFSVMLALVFFAIAMIFLTKVVQNRDSDVRSEILAGQVLEQISPFLQELNVSEDGLQDRYMLAVIKKSFDIFDESLDATIALYDVDGNILIQTESSDWSKTLPPPPTWLARNFPTLVGAAPVTSTRVFSPYGYTLVLEPRQSPEGNALTAVFNLFTGTLLLLFIMGIALWFIAHSITWRINRMSNQILQLGEGDFSVRVQVKGEDEISTLARGFNKSAEKIEQLVNANNLLLAHASHEFRTPITRVHLQLAMMDMLAEHLPDKTREMFLKRAGAITKDMVGLNDLIESILLVSRLDAGQAIQQVVNVDMYELIIQETQHYPQAKFIGDRVSIQGQSKLLVHLVRNLLNNAMIHGVPPIDIYVYTVNRAEDASTIPDRLLNNQFTPSSEENGNQHVNLIKQKHTRNKRRVKLLGFGNNKHKRSTRAQSYMALAVVDQGSGIAEEKRQDIFSPFVRLKQEKKGSGLGLSLVAQIVEAHQGTIITDTWQGHTRFLVVLPMVQNVKETQ